MRTQDKKGFSTIVAMLLTAFLVVVSAGVLGIVLQESKNTRLVYNSISTYAGAEGAQEYALLKIKNHEEGFSDSVKSGSDHDSKLLATNPESVTNKDLSMEYEMANYSKDYSSQIKGGEFEVIPLYFDNGVPMQANSKHPTLTGGLSKTLSFKLAGNKDFVWNILGNNSSGESFGIVGTGADAITMDSESAKGMSKKIEADENLGDDIQKVTYDELPVKGFLSTYDHNYLILFNPGNEILNYTIESNDGFASPKTQIIASAQIGNYRQNLRFEENKNRYFEALKYSIFNK